MCLAIPGKIIEIKDDLAVVDYGSEKRTGRIVDGDYKVGDYVVIQGGLVIEKIPEDQARDWAEAFSK